MLTPLVLMNYWVAAVAIIVSLYVLGRAGWRSIIGVMTLLFVLWHMIGVYWVPDEITLYGPFDESVFNTMLIFHMAAALILTGGCLLQLRVTVAPVGKHYGLAFDVAAVFLVSMALTSLPIAAFMTVMFLLLRFGSKPQAGESHGQPAPARLMATIMRSPLSLVVIIFCASFLAYDLYSSGGLDQILEILRYGFGSLADYLKYRVGSDFTPSVGASLLDTIKASAAPAISLFLLSAFLYKRSWNRLLLLVALSGLVILTKLESFAKSALAVYTIQVALTYSAIVLTKRRLKGRKTRSAFSAGLRLFMGVAASVMTLAWMYSLTHFSDTLTDTVIQISRRIFLIPSQGAYTWFYVFPTPIDFIGFSRSRILSSVFDVPYSVTGYLPYAVAIVATGNRFGLNANFVATGWSQFGAWGLIITVQLVIGTLFVERWLQSVTDPYVYWPVYSFVYGSLLIAVTVPFDGLVLVYGVWLVPILFCLVAKVFAPHVRDRGSTSRVLALQVSQVGPI